MREIEFHVWDKQEEVLYKNNIGILPNNFHSDHMISSDGIFLNPNSDRYIFLQYTGLDDKNGQKIFEGDIIKSCYDYIGLVVYNVPSFEVKRDIAGQTPSKDCDHIMWPSEYFEDVEVIGNKFKDNDLLEVD